MHVLVFGGAGYLGSTLTRELLRREHTVRVIGRSAVDLRLFGIPSARIEYVRGDISAVDDTWFSGMDAMIILAGIGSGPVADAEPLRARRENTDAAHELAVAATKHGLHRAVYASSTAVYEAASPCDDGMLPQQQPATATTYARTKLDGETAFLGGCGPNIASACVRIGGLYGFSPVMRFDVLVNALVRIAVLEHRLVLHNGGELWRPLIGVQDAANALCLELETPQSRRAEVFDAVTENLRINEIAEIIREEAADRALNVSIESQPVTRSLTSYRANSAGLPTRYGNFSKSQMVRGVVGEMLDIFVHPDFDRAQLAAYVYNEWNKAHEHKSN